MTIKIPDFLKELRKPWLSGLDTEMQRHIRFNSNIRKDLRGRYSVVDFMSGGGGTLMEKCIDEKTYIRLKRIMDNEYMQREFDAQEYTDLRSLLNKKKVDLSIRVHRDNLKEDSESFAKVVPKESFEITKKVYDILPEHHFGHEHFKELIMGGYGNGAAKCSEYDDPAVHMFSFAINGARRNYAAMLLHETGHAHLKSLDDTSKKEISECFEVIRKNQRGLYSLFGIDYLFGRESRADYTLSDLEEFAAETYLIYVVRGTELKKQIDQFPNKFKKPWEKLYDIFQQSFQAEYE